MVQSAGGGGVVSALLLVRGSASGPPGAGPGGLLCSGLSLCPPRAGIKACRSVVALPPTLHRLASPCRCLDAVRGVPLRAGAGLLACRGYCWSGRAADWGRVAYGPSGAPPPPPPGVAALLKGRGLPLARRGGCGTAVPLAGLWLSVGLGGERGEVGRRGGSRLSPFGAPVLLSGGCGGAA